jgi:hypothetical protein
MNRGAEPRPSQPEVQKQGGWQSATVLLRIYAKHIEQGEQVANRLPDATPRNRESWRLQTSRA